MRAIFLIVAVVLIACLSLVRAADNVEPLSAAERADALLDVDAGADHSNDSPRAARGYRRYRGYGGYGGYGRRYGGYGGYGRYYG